LLNLFKKKKREIRAPEGKRLYAIGDVHGCFNEMISLIEFIKKDNASRENKECIIVFLGDLIDRGPDSRKVLQYLLDKNIDFASVHCLLGNHEEMFLNILERDDDDYIPKWLVYGGASCVKSYGLDPDDFAGQSAATMQHMIKKNVPKTHINFVKSFVNNIAFGDYILVHAGVNPKRPLDKQSEREMRWIREPFLSWNKSLDYVVIHGHTIEKEVTKFNHRIGVDTGVYESGILSAVRLEDRQVGLLDSNGENRSLMT